MLTLPSHPLHLGPDDAPDQDIPLMTPDQEREMSEAALPETLPVLTLRNTVLFPGVVLPITVGRDASLKLVKDAHAGDKLVAVVAQQRAEVENPGPDDLYDVGTAATILKLIKMPDGSVSIVIQGQRRIEVGAYSQTEPYLRAAVAPLEEPAVPPDDEAPLAARVRSIKELAVQIVNLAPHLPSEAAYAIQNIESPGFLVHFIASNLQVDVDKKQALLETRPLLDRAQLVLEHLEQELRVLEISEEIRSRVKTDVDQQQREFFLRQQLKAIQDELGEGEGGGADAAELRAKMAEKADLLPEAAKETLDKELAKLARTNPASPEYGVVRNYVETILDLPWAHVSTDHLDIARAEEILDEDHYGLGDVKKRILEYLAVLKLKRDLAAADADGDGTPDGEQADAPAHTRPAQAPILCFYGPPGVGKTSLGRSVARALGREFHRISLGGVRDEAEIRGHRRTYIGALPGRILQGLKRAGTSNPVFMLDEIDKLGTDFRGDPASALLEVLDPEQNDSFNDHYLELDYDLSRVLFIATANYLESIPAPLRDRMEIVEINGYTASEKRAIARRYLVPRQLERNGLRDDQFEITDEALALVVDGYTRESGVRQLERAIGSVVRGVAKTVALGEAERGRVDVADVKTHLGARRFHNDTAERTEVPGVATGLAWTPVGGDILFIEASLSRGTGRMTITGKLGEVMRESAVAASSWVRAHADELGIPQDAFRYWDLHIHVPAGAVPKDGPSAGVAMTAALASIYTRRRVRDDVATTGEISLRGQVLPVGGIKEKVLAARRAGLACVVLPEKNRADMEEVKDEAVEGLDVRYVKRVDEALEILLEAEPVDNPVERFRVTDAERRLTGPPPGDGAPLVVSDGNTDSEPEPTVGM